VTDPIRSKIMSAIKSKDTKPELLIRSGLHKLGFRFRVHSKDFVGKPDIVLPRFRAIVLINGCFWHGHDCHIFKQPRQAKWREKIHKNKLRDRRNREVYAAESWKVLTIWECSLFGKTSLPTTQVLAMTARWIQFGEGDADISGKNPK